MPPNDPRVSARITLLSTSEPGAPKTIIATDPMSVIVLFRTTLLVHANAMPLPYADEIALFSTTALAHRGSPPSETWMVVQLRDSTAVTWWIPCPDAEPPATMRAPPGAVPRLG